MISEKRGFRMIALLMIVLLLIVSLPVQSYAKAEEQKTSDNGKFEIQYFLGPDAVQIASDETLAKRIADAGFTIIPLQTGYSDVDGMAGSWAYVGSVGANTLRNAINALDEEDVKVYLKLGTVSSDLLGAGIWDIYSQNLVREYLDGTYDNVIGVDLGDEPPINSADQYANAMARVHETFPKMESYFNLFPIYASDAVLGIGGSYTTFTPGYYEQYLRAFFTQENVNNGLKVFSADYYPKLTELKKPHKGDRTYYENLSLLLKISREHEGTIPMNIVGLCDNLVNPEMKNHIMYQVNTNLAFGMKRLSYFTGSDPSVDPAYAAGKQQATLQGMPHGWNAGWVFEKDGSPSETYDIVKEVNARAHHLGSLLYPKDVVSVDRVSGHDCSLALSYFGNGEYMEQTGQICVTNMDGKKATGIVTVFDDGTFMLTNCSADTAASFAMTKYRVRDMDYFDTTSGTWKPVRKIQLEDAQLQPSENKIVLEGGSALVLRLKEGAKERRVTVKTEIKKATAEKAGKMVQFCTCSAILSSKKIHRISSVKLDESSVVYDGKRKNPEIVIRDSKGNILKKNKDYKVTVPKGRTRIGTYTYTIRYRGSYAGTKKITLTIKPEKVAIKTPKAAKKSVTVKWKRGKKAQTNGYQIMIATNLDFTKNKKKVTVKGYRKVSKKITKLKAKTKYYVRIRTHKTIKGVKVYSNWSGARPFETE